MKSDGFIVALAWLLVVTLLVSPLSQGQLDPPSDALDCTIPQSNRWICASSIGVWSDRAP